MKPNLVCKIEVRTAKGKRRTGSGYPIAPNRIITAAHVVKDAAPAEEVVEDGDARRISLFFGVRSEKLETPVFIEWYGQDCGVDVAVLRCQLPSELQPDHRLLTQPCGKQIEWIAHGYTDFGRQHRPDGRDGYYGKLTTLPDDRPTVVLDVGNGLTNVKQWKGGSGSMAFDSATGQMALAVLTEYHGGKKLDQLVAVPLCYLLNAEATKGNFRRAIQFDVYERRKDYRNDVIKTVSLKLELLGPKALKRVAHALHALKKEETSAIIDCDLSDKARADKVAECVVFRIAVTDVIGCLDSLVPDLGHEAAEHIADIIDHLLPLNYAPGVIHRLHAQLAADQLGLIESEVTTLSLAEIIMAGYDQQPARFVPFTDGDTDVRGQTALPYPDGPEEGPNQAGAESVSVLRVVRNLLYDLFAQKDTLRGRPPGTRSRTMPEAQSEAELRADIQDYGTRLRGALQYVSKSRRGRTVYCVLKLPAPPNPQRDFYKRVLEEAHTHVPQLIFVELMERAKEEREFEVAEYYLTRVARTPRGEKV